MKKTALWVVVNCLLLVAMVLGSIKLLDSWKERQISQFVARQEKRFLQMDNQKIQDGNVASTHVVAAIPTDMEGHAIPAVESQIMEFVKEELGEKKPVGKIEHLLFVSTTDSKTNFKQIQAKEIHSKQYRVDFFNIKEEKNRTGQRILLRADNQLFTLVDFLPNVSGAKNIIVSKLREELEKNQLDPVSIEQALTLCKTIELAELDFTYTDGQLTITFPDKSYGVETLTLPLTDLYPVINSDYLSDADKSTYDTYVAEQAIDKKALRQIALTFDDGPNPSTTPRVLDLLKKYGAKGTFFVIGKSVAGNEDLLKRIVAEGHEVGNHTWNHPNLTAIPVEEVRKEIQDTQEAIKAVIGKDTTMVRPPYGAINQAAVDAMGLPSIYWSVDSEDWRNRDQHIIFERIKSQTQPGSIILMHDIHQPTVDALESVLQFLSTEGYHMVTTTELLGGNLNPQLIYYNQEHAGPAH